MPRHALNTAVRRIHDLNSRATRTRIAAFRAIQRLIEDTGVWSDIYEDAATLMQQENLCRPSAFSAFRAVRNQYGDPLIDAIGIAGCNLFQRLTGGLCDHVAGRSIMRANALGRSLTMGEMREIVHEVTVERSPNGPRPPSRGGRVEFEANGHRSIEREVSRMLRQVARMRQEAMLTGHAGTVDQILHEHLPAVINRLRRAVETDPAEATSPSAAN